MSDSAGSALRRHSNLPRPATSARASALPSRRTSRPGAAASREPSPAPVAQAYAARRAGAAPQRSLVHSTSTKQADACDQTPRVARARGDSPAPRQTPTAQQSRLAPKSSVKRASTFTTSRASAGSAQQQGALQSAASQSRAPAKSPLRRPAGGPAPAGTNPSRIGGPSAFTSTTSTSTGTRATASRNSQPASPSRLRAPGPGSHSSVRGGNTALSTRGKPANDLRQQNQSALPRTAPAARRVSAAGSNALPDRGDFASNPAKNPRAGLTPSKYPRRISGSGASTASPSVARKLYLGIDAQGDEAQVDAQRQSSLPLANQRRTSGAAGTSVLQSFRAARRASVGGNDDDTITPAAQETRSAVAGNESRPRHGTGALSKFRSKTHHGPHASHLPDRDDKMPRSGLTVADNGSLADVDAREMLSDSFSDPEGSAIPCRTTTATTSTAKPSQSLADDEVENADPSIPVTSPEPTRRWTSMSERFANANINTDKVDRMAMSIGGRRSRGLSQTGALEPFPTETPRLRRSSVQLSKKLVLSEASSSSSTDSSSSDSSGFSDDSGTSTKATFSSCFPDRNGQKISFTVSSKTMQRRRPFAPANLNNNADLSWIDSSTQEASSPPLF